MRGNMLGRVLAVLPAAALAVMGALGQQQDAGQSQTGDSVADAARKAREEKKTAPKAKKVVTDDDIAPRAAAPAKATTEPAPSGEKSSTDKQAAKNAASTKEAGEPKEDPNGEAAWRKRFATQHAKIAKAEQELDVLQREVQKSGVQYYSDPQKAMSEQNTRKEISDKNAKIEAKKQEIGQLKQELADMEDRLRKSGGDPGWARY